MLFDIGESMNPGIDIGQIEGAYSNAIGFYMGQEEVLIDSKGLCREGGTWEYKPPLASEMPIEFHVELLRDSSADNPVNLISSKAVGEPPFQFGYSALGAVKMAIRSARKDAGLSQDVNLPMPCSVAEVKLACGTTTSMFQC